MGLITLNEKKRALRGGGSPKAVNPQSFSTAAQFPASLGEERLESNQSSATRLLNDYPELEGNADIRQIEETGFLDKAKRAVGGFLQATGLDTALRFIDTPRRLIQLGAMDVFGGDSKYGKEITAGNYWEVATQQDQRLVDRLGAEVVGEYGDLSGSVIFDALGWEKTDNFLNNFFRGTTQFIYDAATDPTTYISAGLAGLGKKAATEAAELTLRDAAKAAARRVTGQLDEVGESALEASMRTTIKAEAEVLTNARFAKAVAEVGDDVMDGTAKSSLRNKLFNEAVDEVELTVGDSWTTRVAQPIINKDFASLPEEYITHHATRNMTEAELKAAGLFGEAKTAPWTTGGLRFGSPFGKRTFGSIPGTRGLGRKIVGDPVRKGIKKATTKFPSLHRAQRAVKWLNSGSGYEKALLDIGRQGKHYGAVSRALKELSAEARELGDDSGRLLLRNQIVNITNGAVDLTDAEYDDLIRMAFHGAQNGGAIPVEMLEGLDGDLAAEVQQAAKVGHDIAARAHAGLSKSDIRVGQIQNFTPMRIVPEFRENLRVLMQDGAPITIPVHDGEAMQRLAAELGNDVTVEDLVIFADVWQHATPGMAGAQVLGDTTSLHQRTLGRTAVARMDDSGMLWINEADVLPDGRSVRAAYASSEELNDGLMRVFDAIHDATDSTVAYPMRKSTRAGEGQIALRAIQDDPLELWNGYLDSVQKAAFEAKLIAKSRELGLIKSPDYAEVLDQTLFLVRPALKETPDIVERVIAGHAKALRELSEYKLPREAYHIGGVEVQLPEGWRKNRSMRAAVKRYEEQQAKVERTLIEVKKMRNETAARLQRDVPGMDADEAMRWAVSTSTSLAGLRGAARQEALDMAVEVTTAVHTTLLGLDEAARDQAYKRLGEVEARVAEITRAHADAMDELTARYAEKAGAAVPRQTSYTQVGADGLYDDVATRDAFSAILVHAQSAYDAGAEGGARHVDESIAALQERVAEVGSREKLPWPERRRLEHLENMRDAYSEGSTALQALVKTASASRSEQLLFDLRDVLDSGFAGLAKPRVAKAIEAKMTAMMQEGGHMWHSLWDDDQFRELLAVGVRARQGHEIGRELQKAGTRVSGAETLRQAHERVDAFIRAARAEVQAQGKAYEAAAQRSSRRQAKGVTAFMAGDFDVASGYVHEITEYIAAATGMKGGLTMTKVAAGKNRDRWIVEWVHDVADVAPNAPSLKEMAQALRDGKFSPEQLAGRNLSEVVWYRDLEDSMASGVHEAAVRAARDEVDRVGVAMSPWLSGDYNAYMDRVKSMAGIDVRETRTGGTQVARLDKARAAEIADLYDDGYQRFLAEGPTPEAVRAYETMVDETVAQYRTIADEDGIKFEIYLGEGEPYLSSDEMVRDVVENKRLKILPTGDTSHIAHADVNPLYRETGIVVDVVNDAGEVVGQHNLLGNDLFRGVHDYYGHSRLGNQFGPSGEETAWLLHSRMYSPEARAAITTETRGQNSWVNFGKQLRREDGSLPVKGDPDWIHPSERPFAEQGMFLMPDHVVHDRRYKELLGFDAVGPRGPRQVGDATRVWNDVFSKKIDAALAGHKGAATRLKNAVSQTVNGDVKVSAEWRALEAALPENEAARLKALIRNLVLQDQAATPVERRLLRMNQAAIMHGDQFAPVEATLGRLREVAAKLDERARNAKSVEHIDAIRAARQLNDTVKRVASRVAETDANGTVRGVPARLAALDAAFREDMELAARLAEELGIDQSTRNTVRGLKSVKSAKELGTTKREVSFLQKHFTEVADSAQVRGIREGYAVGSSRGLGGSLADVDIDPHVALLFENMTDNMRALQTPLGVTMLQRTGHGFMNLWKSQATIARPAFHTRNFISATWNNMIIGVGMKEYVQVFGAAAAFRKALEKSGSIDDALLAVSERMRPVVQAAWEDHVLQVGFANSTFRSNVPTRGLSAGKKALNAVNPASDQFALTVAGSSFMTRIEDFHRMAAFHKFYDPNVPASSALAREMVMGVHFDYENLTAIERKIKSVAPFFVWTRRNIPLQLRVMLEQPGIAQRYAHLMDAVRDNFGDEDDAFPVSPWLNSQAVTLGGGKREDSDFWMNFVFDPDMPIVDLESLPMFGERGLAGTFSPTEWLNFGASMLGPHVSMPFQLDAQEDFGDVNAPFGLNEAFRLLDNIDFWGGIDVSEAGDVQISYNTRSIFETLLPFYREYTAGFENDPNRAAKLGIPEDPSAGDILKGYGASFGKGLGLQGTSPGDTKGPAYQAQEILREYRLRQQKGIG